MSETPYENLDWNHLWQQAREQKSWQSKGEEDWDKKAPSFAKRTARSLYVRQFLKLLNPEKSWTVLDVGSGPGTIALPLATKVKHITCLDFSANMLQILKEQAIKQNLGNITTTKVSWENSWQNHGIAPHDIAIASRSLNVQDLRAGLARLSAYGLKKVVITDRVQHGPFDPLAFEATGRSLQAGPDYIYTVNLLYQMGYLATVDFIRLEEQLVYPSFEEALAGYTWMFRDLTEEEKKLLRQYVLSITTFEQDGSVVVQRRHVPTWAFISWEPSPTHTIESL